MKKPGRRRHGSVTIQHVAEAAGVSAMTVSRVINGETNVRPATRAAVQEVIERLNYSPNTAARNLAAGEALHLGLLYANPSAAYLSLFLVGALDAARRAGCHILLEPCEPGQPDGQAEATRRFAASGVDGVILPPPLSEAPAVHAELRRAGIPVVTVAMGLPHPGIDNVRIDDHAASAAMTQHLLALGHRRIGFILGEPHNTVSGIRHDGARRALAKAGVAEADMPVEQGHFTYRSGLAATERLLALHPRPTAIFASNDDMAAAAVSVAHRLGLDVPRDLSIVGFDDSAPATTIWPELTTVRQPIAEMAAAAVELLLERIRAKRAGQDMPARETILDHALILRESTAPAGRN